MSRALSTLDLLDRCRDCLVEAGAATDVRGRFLAARLAALQAGAAVLVARAPGPLAATGPRDVWSLLGTLAPELAEWADFFALATSLEREGPSAGTPGGLRVVTTREADDLLRSAQAFLDLVRGRLGLPRPDDLPHRSVAVRSA